MTMDAMFNFADQQSVVKLFEGRGEPVKLVIDLTAKTGSDGTFRGRFVSADDAALTSNVVDLCETGTSSTITAYPKRYELTVGGQTTAKRYYGLIMTVATATTMTVNAYITHDAQSNLTDWVGTLP
jgi:hypothetical protein